MNAAYFAIGCILIILVIYWGCAEKEELRLSALFGQQRQKRLDAQPPEPTKPKRP
jgi:hypothetical protein